MNRRDIFITSAEGNRFWPRVLSNRRKRAAVLLIVTTTLLFLVWLAGMLMPAERLVSNLDEKSLSPTWAHPFGTDWLGRDMFARTVKGLSTSIGIGLIASLTSLAIATCMGLAAALLGKQVDRLITWLIDLFLGLPHIVTMILISFALGGGVHSVMIGIAATHWTGLARVVRAEVMQLASAEYIQISRRLGKSRWWVATRHMFPHLLPQLLVGTILLFPHAILHEAAITFLGMGLPDSQPAIGVILSEAMQYLSAGLWWLAVFPGLSLLLIVRCFDQLGDHVRLLLDPRRAHE